MKKDLHLLQEAYSQSQLMNEGWVEDIANKLKVTSAVAAAALTSAGCTADNCPVELQQQAEDAIKQTQQSSTNAELPQGTPQVITPEEDPTKTNVDPDTFEIPTISTPSTQKTPQGTPQVITPDPDEEEEDGYMELQYKGQPVYIPAHLRNQIKLAK